MKKYFAKKSCITLALVLCVGIFAQQKIYAQQKENAEGMRNLPTQVNVEFTDMSAVKGFEIKADSYFNSVTGVAGTGTFNIATGTGTGDGWTWNAPVLTILDASNVTITGRANQPDNHHRVVIAAGATTHVTLSDASIVTGEYVSGDLEHPIYLDQGATLNLTIEGENIITAGDYVPGISVAFGRTIIIGGTGSLSATGGWTASGIGGGYDYYGPCGTITINGGTIYAKGGNSSWIGTASAGIGSGAAYPNGNITINGGSVIGVPGNETAKGIGTGGIDEEIGTLTITGNPIIFTNGISDPNPEIKTGGILVTRNATHWYGNDNFTLEYNTTVPNTNLLTIGEGKSITIPAGITMINQGTIVNYSGITIHGTLINNGSILNVNAGTVSGTVNGNAPTTVTPAGSHIDLSNTNPSRVGDGWVFANNVYAILDGADVNISGSGPRRVEVAHNAMANIALNNASITGIGAYLTPFLINAGAEVNLTIEGVNTLTAGRSKAGLQVPESATVTIAGTGSLKATGGEYGGAGIGGAFCENAGTVTVNGGTISGISIWPAHSYHSGAGIGGGGAGIVFFSFEGAGGLGGDVTVNGGVVTGTAEPGTSAGIGGGGASKHGGTLTMEANGVTFASILETYNGIQTDINGVVNGILFDDINGIFYGASVKITDDLEIPVSYKLTIPAGSTLIIPNGKTLTVNGTVINNGEIINCGTIIGTIENNQPADCDQETYTITFYVFDADTELPVLDAVITFNGEELEGYEVEISEGNYAYTVFHPDYEIYSATQYVNASTTINIPLITLGIIGISTDNIVLYPNPFTNEIYISDPSVVKSVQITNAAGRNVKNFVFNGKSIATENLNSGIYFIILEDYSGGKVVNKIIKK
ncbi:MAG: T9SS type A sorting domain-containing protein [Lentimicrobiaceae bacterium]|nr:T9SS type A sorting domain-containing protein [Lentimicrobiaceae bacterium]